MYMYMLMANDSAKREKQMMQERGGSLAGEGRGRDQKPVFLSRGDRDLGAANAGVCLR